MKESKLVPETISKPLSRPAYNLGDFAQELTLSLSLSHPLSLTLSLFLSLLIRSIRCPRRGQRRISPNQATLRAVLPSKRETFEPRVLQLLNGDRNVV